MPQLNFDDTFLPPERPPPPKEPPPPEPPPTAPPPPPTEAAAPPTQGTLGPTQPTPGGTQPTSEASQTLAGLTTDRSVYLAVGGLWKHIPDPATFAALGLDWNAISWYGELPGSIGDELPSAAPPSATPGTNAAAVATTETQAANPALPLAGLLSDHSVYFAAGGLWHYIPDVETFEALGFDWDSVNWYGELPGSIGDPLGFSLQRAPTPPSSEDLGSTARRHRIQPTEDGTPVPVPSQPFTRRPLFSVPGAATALLPPGLQLPGVEVGLLDKAVKQPWTRGLVVWTRTVVLGEVSASKGDADIKFNPVTGEATITAGGVTFKDKSIGVAFGPNAEQKESRATYGNKPLPLEPIRYIGETRWVAEDFALLTAVKGTIERTVGGVRFEYSAEIGIEARFSPEATLIGALGIALGLALKNGATVVVNIPIPAPWGFPIPARGGSPIPAFGLAS
jgi:hypothetical protein